MTYDTDCPICREPLHSAGATLIQHCCNDKVTRTFHAECFKNTKSDSCLVCGAPMATLVVRAAPSIDIPAEVVGHHYAAPRAQWLYLFGCIAWCVCVIDILVLCYGASYVLTVRDLEIIIAQVPVRCDVGFITAMLLQIATLVLLVAKDSFGFPHFGVFATFLTHCGSFTVSVVVFNIVLCGDIGTEWALSALLIGFLAVTLHSLLAFFTFTSCIYDTGPLQ